MAARAKALGFSQIGIAGVDLSEAEPGLLAWLAAGFHGGMDYMARHGLKRARPAELLPGTLSVLTARMDYLPPAGPPAPAATAPAGGCATRAPAAPAPDWRERERRRQADPAQAVVSIYARGRDYHKVLRQRLQQLADFLAAELARLQAGGTSPAGWPAGLEARVFTDSAPVLEVELASRSGLGWRGKHTLTLSRGAGSMFFLGEIFVNLPLPPSAPVAGHCGQCRACLDACPTGAIVAPYRLDARRCISYLTIEHEGPIPVELRPLLGNRIYGCDDCQLACPWNKFAQPATLADFAPRSGLDEASLLALWAWDEAEFLRRTEGSPIRRIGHARWRRNLAVAMGNALVAGAPGADALRAALAQALPQAPEPLAEHIRWALACRAGGAV